MNHTQEPWEVVEHSWAETGIYAKGKGRVAGVRHDPEEDPLAEQAPANAARIVACVNACEGIDPEAIGAMIRALQLVDNAYEDVVTFPLDQVRRALKKAGLCTIETKQGGGR